MDSELHPVQQFHDELYRAWGQQHWWPGRSAFEVVLGAFLTQNTSWNNVEKALANLRAHHAASVRGIRDISLRRLERLIQPSGYFRQKARRIKLFVEHLDGMYAGSLKKLLAQPTEQLRAELLTMEGIGPETADSILLYAGGHEVFVVDAYTRRIVERHGILASSAGYEEIRRMFEENLRPADMVDEPRHDFTATDQRQKGAAHRPSAASRLQRSLQAQVFAEMHALIVGVGKDYCKKSQPRCDGCPLQRFLPVQK